MCGSAALQSYRSQTSDLTTPEYINLSKRQRIKTELTNMTREPAMPSHMVEIYTASRCPDYMLSWRWNPSICAEEHTHYAHHICPMSFLSHRHRVIERMETSVPLGQTDLEGALTVSHNKMTTYTVSAFCPTTFGVFKEVKFGSNSRRAALSTYYTQNLPVCLYEALFTRKFPNIYV